MKIIPVLVVAALILVLPATAPAFAKEGQMVMGTANRSIDVGLSTTPRIPVPDDDMTLHIEFINPTTHDTQIHIDYRVTISDEAGAPVFGPTDSIHTSSGIANIPVNLARGEYDVTVDVEGILFQPIPVDMAIFSLPVGVDGNPGRNGCLIATAAYGSELAPQVQALREVRDETLLSTESGASFIAAFNTAYYAFSPQIADLEREYPAVREMTRIAITPMISTLGIMTHAEPGSELDVITLGIGVIALNLGIYAGLPLASAAVIRSRWRTMRST